MKSSYMINGQAFSALQDVREEIRRIKGSYLDSEPLNKNDFSFMLDVLKRHENADIKIGCGIESIIIRTNSVFKNNREFWIIRKDGSTTDFSFEKCLRNKKWDRMNDFKSACREAVSDDIISFKKWFFRVCPSPLCPITGETLTTENAHVDHMPPNTFDEIVKSFINGYSIDTKKEIIKGINADGITRKMFANDITRQIFRKYHSKCASLRVISKKANLSDVKLELKARKGLSDAYAELMIVYGMRGKLWSLIREIRQRIDEHNGPLRFTDWYRDWWERALKQEEEINSRAEEEWQFAKKIMELLNRNNGGI